MCVCLQDLQEETLFMIAGRATPVKMAPGHEICSQGDPADCIWLLHEGTPRGLPPVSVCLCVFLSVCLPVCGHAQSLRKAQQLVHMSSWGDVVGKKHQVYC